jgi:dCTP deaminase
MTILADHQIAKLARSGMIDPFIPKQTRELYEHDGTPHKVISYGLSSYGYDVRLGNEIAEPVFTHALFDPKNPSTYDFDTVTIPDGGIYIIRAGTFILAHALEYLRLPNDVSGQVWGKSTYNRAGIVVHCTPLEAGWEGQITLEIKNDSRRDVMLYVGEGIAQVQFYQGAPCDVPYDSGRKYQGQRGVTLGRV